MSRPVLRLVTSVCLIIIPVWSIQSQAAVPPSPAQPTPPPATKLEAFRPSAGSVTTLGFKRLGSVGGVSVEVRELRGASGVSVRGLVVDVYQSQYRSERAFVDADEIPELLKGIAAIADVKTNPTRLESFEVDYETRGALEVSAYSSSNQIKYAIQTGRTLTALDTGLDSVALEKFRAMIAAGFEILNGLGTKAP